MSLDDYNSPIQVMIRTYRREGREETLSQIDSYLKSRLVGLPYYRGDVARGHTRSLMELVDAIVRQEGAEVCLHCGKAKGVKI